MKKFIKEILLFGLIPFIPFCFLSIGYFYFDPFKVIYKYKNYSNSNVILNRDYISTEMFLKNYASQQYNSFIFGSSRTLGFSPVSWKKHLASTDHPFVFDAVCESIYGIYTKMKFLDSTNVKLDNVILIIDRDFTFGESNNNHNLLTTKHYIVSKESKLHFELIFFKSYFNPKFLFNYYKFLLTKKITPSMSSYLEARKIVFDTITNEQKIIDQEIELSNNLAQYYQKRASIFYNRSKEHTDSTQRITAEMVVMFKEISRILQKNNSKYKVILTPLYEQTKFNPKDYHFLKQLFGKNLYDFTGKNTFTDSKFNYYESSHFRPTVGDSIFNYIYK